MVYQVYLENVLEMLVDSFCFKNQDILKIALQISSQIDRLVQISSQIDRLVQISSQIDTG